MAELAFMVAGSVLEKLRSVAKDEISLAWGVKKDLNKLKDKTLMLKSVLQDAEKKQARDEQLRAWLVCVKDVFNDAVDVLDEVDCEALRRQVVTEYGSVGTKVRRFFSSANPIAFRFSIAQKVKEILERLDEISQDMAQFQLISSQLNDHEEQSQLIDQERRDRVTHSYVKDSEVIGRESDKACILDMLLRQDNDGDGNLSVIAIVGMGGFGKTTLSKSVYNDEKVDRSFDLKLWVCVSSDFDVTRLVKEILRAAKVEGDVNNMSIDELQTSLRRVLQGKRFLLVLDDVWNEDRIKWLELRQFLTGDEKGSKVIVTTRSTSVSSIMTRTPPYHLQVLSQEDSLSLFFTCAFEDEKLAEQYPRLKDIGKEIVRKCGGVPLALKTLGSLLYSKNEADWIRVRDNEIWELEREDGHILPALRMSYSTMSPLLKQCFAYCSTFPDDTPLNTCELISIWMALGILQSPNGKMDLEDIGKLQIKELSARSFFQYESDFYDRDTEIHGLYFFHNRKMHDLVHDLARSVTNSECSIVESSGKLVSDSVRHLRIFLNQNNLTLVQRLKKLWSIHIDASSEDSTTKSFLVTCITRLRYLRVFDLQDLSFEELPNSIGTLKHLRYLNLSGNIEIRRLPESICELQSLQTLLLVACSELEELPRSIRKLVSLRTLYVTTKQENFPENGIGRLKSLRTLVIAGCENLRSLPRDMKYCTTLRTLFIFECEQLDLASESDEVVTELSLQTLHIVELPKTTALPQWLKGASQTLKILYIEECNNLAVLPVWLPNLVSLRTLFIQDCEKLPALPDEIQHLPSLMHLITDQD